MFKVPTAVQMRLTLQEMDPPIWRRLIVPRTFHLGELHQVIQAAFGWWDYHLHEFQIGGLSFSDPELVKPEFEGDPRVYDEREVQLLDFSRGEEINFVYAYDFGDEWHHLVELEQLSLWNLPRAWRDVSMALAHDHPRMLAARTAMRASSRVWPIAAIPSTPNTNAGLAATSIQNGSPSACAIETCAERLHPIVRSVSSSRVRVEPGVVPRTHPDPIGHSRAQ